MVWLQAVEFRVGPQPVRSLASLFRNISLWSRDIIRTTVHQSTGFRVSDHMVGCVLANRHLLKLCERGSLSQEMFVKYI
jgi:hypothetical protein